MQAQRRAQAGKIGNCSHTGDGVPVFDELSPYHLNG
jgi:hypothetical protein